MAIAKNPLPTSRNKDTAATRFIDKQPQTRTRTRVSMLFDSAILKKMDDEAQRRGMTRTAWVHYIISDALEK